MAQPRVIGDAGLAASAERGLTKLLAALPVSLRERAVSMRQRLYVDATGWRGPAQNLSALPLVQDAVSRDRALMIRYRQAGRERVERTIDPLGLVAKGTTWYLVANTPKGFRTYRVSRIEEATLLETRFDRPANFDLERYWKASTEQFHLRQQYVATLRLEPGAADSIRTVVPRAARANGWPSRSGRMGDAACAIRRRGRRVLRRPGFRSTGGRHRTGKSTDAGASRRCRDGRAHAGPKSPTPDPVTFGWLGTRDGIRAFCKPARQNRSVNSAIPSA